ncbi:MAG: hypothetical protein BA874_08635 [Desulfuromonadales bacterium C00003068]|nr:MAG: hypothetical protein BA874_08635 [Desulfuromonadales bacterium C00003068]
MIVTAKSDIPAPNDWLKIELERLQQENLRLKLENEKTITYVRAKVDQLLKIMGTLPLRQEELDDETLISLDPIGIVGDSFSQVLDHLHQTNDELTVARDELRAIFDATGAAILVLDLDLNLHSCNPKSIERFGMNREKSVGLPLTEAIPNCTELLDDAFITRLTTSPAPFGSISTPVELEISFLDYCYHLIATPVRDSNDHPWFYVLIFSDITDRKKTEESLIVAETRLTAILNTMMAGVMIIDPETHKIVDVNHMAATIIGTSPEKIIGSVCHRFVCPSSNGQCPITDLNQVIDNSDRILLNANKERISILKTATMIELSGKSFILESFIDIQARKEAEKALSKSEQRYRSLYSSMKEGMLIGELVYSEAGFATDYVIVDLNQACGKMMEINVDEVIGVSASSWYEDGLIANLQIIDSVVETGVPQEYELRLEQLGKVFHVSLSRPELGQFAAIINDVTDSKKAQKEIERLAYYDTLTGLPNRVLIKDRLQQAMAQADRSRGLVGVLALDLDHFKKINDSLGVGSGDQMLKKVADRLSSHLRQGDSVARMGGDEFVIVLSNIKTQNDIAAAAAKVLDLLCESVAIDGHDLVCTGSLGIAMYPMDADEVELLLTNADTAQYQAKETGRNLYQFYSPDMNTRAFERLFLDSDLHRAIERDELEVYYQPQINIEKGEVVGVEALLRWNHKEKGQISPAVFIPLAEETDLILEIGKWVLDHACQQGQQWRDAGHGDLRVAVNLSARQFRSDLPNIVASALQGSSFPPHLLELELTEGLLMDKPEMARVILNQLQDLGVSLSIDDFGTGYSSLSYLKHFPLNRLKIDRSFVKDLSVDSDDATIVEAIIALAHGLRLHVVAEGVETVAQLEFMKAHRCDEVQGFLMARPMTETNFLQFLQDYNPSQYRLI